jgi:hypothetical protein
MRAHSSADNRLAPRRAFAGASIQRVDPRRGLPSAS